MTNINLPATGSTGWDATINADLTALNAGKVELTQEQADVAAAQSNANANTSAHYLPIVFPVVVVSNSHDYTVQPTDRFVAVTALTAGIAVILPDAATLPHVLITVKDESGQAALNTITVKSAVSTQKIDGDGTKQISSNYGAYRLYSNGTQWYSLQ